ncbi:LamG-like jellyroll fold domain-containing protein [Streptomyces sp. 4N509B]|uniref:LamG-like jellyroll fold domain-containing protein n=1 Tax=Streptomyces sp. 4N509B TaxID=3457413 RepID=UPI003FD2C4FF
MLSLRGESREVFAHPDGTLEAREYLRPVWTREDGEWREVDTTLAVGPDGVVVPGATTVGLAFSGGGVDDPLVQMTRAGRVLELSWPGSLPAPELDGAEAVYRDVLPDVDLRMGATPDGFTQLLVVHTAEAAASAELTELTLGLSAEGMDVQVTPEGGVEAVDVGAGSPVFEAPVPIMWDSSGGDTASGGAVTDSASSAGAGGPEPLTDPAESARRAEVAVEVTDDGLSLTPDEGLLRGADTQFPVFIDPQWHSPKATAWTMVSRYWHDSPQWRFNGENNAGLGYCGWDYCAPYDLKRLFYRIPINEDFGGAEITNADFVVRNVHSASCTAREVQIWRTKGIDSGTTWDTQDNDAFWIDRLDTRSFAYGSDECAAADAEFDVTSAMRQAVDNDWQSLTFGMRATSEDDRLGWKRFADEAFLRVTYNRPPPQLRTNQLVMEYGGQCPSPSDPARVRSRGKIYATNLRDPDGDQLRVQFRAFWDAGDGQGNIVRWETALTTGQGDDSLVAVRLPTSMPDNGRVQWEARSHDGKQYSPWSGSGTPHRCTFHMDTTTPTAPTIVSPEYPATAPENPLDPWHDGAGRYGDFTFDSAASDVNRYRYGLNGEPLTANQLTTTGGDPRTARLLPDAGVNVLTVQALDTAGNASEEHSYVFRVRAGSPERVVWDLDEEAGASSAQGRGEPWSAALTGDAAPGVAGARGTALRLGGAGGHAVTEVPVVDTSKSFSVSFWARLPEAGITGSGTAVSQAGKVGNAFRLSVDPGSGGWSFSRTGADNSSAAVTTVRQGQAAALGAWTHVVGVYKRVDGGQLLLYVDGQPAGSVAFGDWWEARGTVALGAALTGQTAGDFFAGELDEVRFYDYWLTDAQVAALHAHEEITAGSRPALAVWSLDEPADATAVAGYSQPSPAEVHGQVAFGGEGVTGTAASFTAGSGHVATTQPVLDTYQSFTLAAWVKLPANKPNQNMVVAAQTASHNWGFSLLHAADGRGWTFRRWTADDTSGSLVQASQSPCTASEPDCPAAGLGGWTHVAGVHDIDRREIRLYVNGQLAASESFTGLWTANGRVTIGAADHRDGTTSGELTGQIDDVRLFDRMATGDEVWQLFHQNPRIAGRWQFEQTDAAGTTTPDSSVAGNPLNLSGGPAVGSGRIDASALLLDGVNDHAATTTGTVPMDTSASFTVAAWAQAAALPQNAATLVSGAGSTRSAFAVRYVPDPASGRNVWQIALADDDSEAATVVSVDNTEFSDVRYWNHIALVYDGFRRQAQLYVNGRLDEVACLDETDDACGSVSWANNVTTFDAAHSLQVGRARTPSGAWGEYWPGAVDDLWAFRGALTTAQVAWLATGYSGVETEIPTS